MNTRPSVRLVLLALYGLTSAALRDDALLVLLDAVPMWARRIGGVHGPYMWYARRCQRRWWGPENAR